MKPLCASVFAFFALSAGAAPRLPPPSPSTVAPQNLPRVATVDERFQSYNVEMVQVTGGTFWKPYSQLGDTLAKASSGGAQGPSFYANLKGPLAPIDLGDPQLRKLAAALGPAYLRVSGSDANAVYFHDSDSPAPEKAPKGFNTVLTREQWRGVVEFARAVNAEIVTSFAVSEGVRDGQGNWTPEQARRRLEYTKSLGGRIAAAELANEPNLAPAGAVYTPPGYDAQVFARDFAAFRALAHEVAPDMVLLGPGSTSEGVKLVPENVIPSTEFFVATPRPEFDGFSYHAYGASSIRCLGSGRVNTAATDALTGEWLNRTDVVLDTYVPLRDRFMPGKEFWLTETAQSSCGGDLWSKTFLDSFRYLDQLGFHARRGVKTVMYNTLAVSDYGLVDSKTKEPRPNYWAALLWRRLMGSVVLDALVPAREGLHLYAHCMPGNSGGVTLLAINNSRTRRETLGVSAPSQRYTLSAPKLESPQVLLNGRVLQLTAAGDLPELRPTATPAGTIRLEPATITFLAVPGAKNASCR